MEKNMCRSFEEAQEALDRGETVRIAVEPFRIDPALIQLALDLQAKDRMEAWKRLNLEKSKGRLMVKVFSDVDTHRSIAMMEVEGRVNAFLANYEPEQIISVTPQVTESDDCVRYTVTVVVQQQI